MSLSSRADQLPPTLGQAYEGKEKLALSPGKVTWLAIDRQTDLPVIIKLLFFDQHFDWQHHKLFEREAQVLQNLSHPSLPKFIKLIDFQDEQNNGFASVQSFIPGTSLAQYIKQGRTFSEEELKELAKKMLEILDFLHSRNPPIIHRDIKPSNILLGDRTANSIGDVFLVDFDAVQTIITPGSTRTVVGSYGYMPPEQFGDRVVPASDLYALGATLIYIATGQQPADLPQKKLKLQFEPFVQLSSEFSDWINQAIEPSLEERFSSASDALIVLNQAPVNNDAIIRQSSPLTQNSGKVSASQIDNRHSEHVDYEQSEHRLQISIFPSRRNRRSIFPSRRDFLIYAMFHLCWILFILGILLLQTPSGLSLFAATILLYIAIAIPVVSYAPNIFLPSRILFKWVWPSLGRYRISIDANYLTIEAKILGFSKSIKYPLNSISSVDFTLAPTSLGQAFFMQRHRQLPESRQHVDLEINPFANLEKQEIEALKQKLRRWLKVPTERPSPPDSLD